ncbi:MAG: DNA polymerase III subunit gamma/tau [Candidatus Nomurabacteria bacterium]|jgi:DNA polymerase-3 subunit gamma/tau|nr:DNA polymerase III subunit gamma/tau [Candidatus Nomurabacteria bacterium]
MSVREESAKGVSSGKIALYRKYRPGKLADIVGQPQVTEILNAAAKAGQFSHAYLFTGQRGTGKTSTARILAHLINKTPYDIDNPGTDLDIIEIDAASRGSVDDARELRDKSAIAPVAAAHKIYIIDEVHMLSTPAFNALLKIIEEPPAHIVFILATTEIQKVPATILSRVQRFHFRPVSIESLASHLRQIAEQEKIKVDDEALNLIAERGQGSFRDSISLLDQLSNSGSKITRATVEEILGLAPETTIFSIIDAITTHDVTTVVTTLNDLFKDGVASSLIVDQLINELTKLAPEKPKLYDLVERLLEVAKSHAPDIKLTAILATVATKNTPTTSAALVASPPAKEKLADIIEKKIAEEQKSNKLGQPQQPVATDLASDATNFPSEITWNDILSEVKAIDEPAVLATLKFADFDYVDGQVTLYFSKPFHRKKADSTKFRSVFGSAFHKLHDARPKIIVSNLAVRENSDAARILDIMGGGEVIRNGKA